MCLSSGLFKLLPAIKQEWNTFVFADHPGAKHDRPFLGKAQLGAGPLKRGQLRHVLEKSREEVTEKRLSAATLNLRDEFPARFVAMADHSVHVNDRRAAGR